MNISVCVLASGSKGNSVYISDGKTSILIDAGLSCRETEKRLVSKNICAADISALIISHEHADHIKGAGAFARRYKVPVYINKKTETASRDMLGRLDNIKNFECGRDFKIDTLLLHPFSISHDAVDPSAFTLKSDGNKVGIATDLGVAGNLVKEHLKDCSLLILEANHDIEMLKKGPYPWHLKQRISGRKGHLSNIDAKTFLAELNQQKLLHVVLGHLSEINNTAEKAVAAVKESIKNKNITLSPAFQDKSSEMFII